MPGIRSRVFFIMGIVALAAGCGGATEDDLFGGGPGSQGGSAGAGATSNEGGSGNTGESGSGNTGEAGSGNTGEAGSGNTGEAGSGNTGEAGSGNTANCDVSACESVSVFGLLNLPGCCPSNGGGCGLDVSEAEQYAGVTGCIELNQEGRVDPGCPTESRPAQGGLPASEFPGCCRPDNTCGYWVDMSSYSIPSFGCVDPSAVGGPSTGLPCNY